MPAKTKIARATRDARRGKAPSTQAGEFVREEIEHVREGKHGARSTKQAIAIGLSKARRAGVDLPVPAKGTVSDATRRKSKRDGAIGARGGGQPSAKRSRATTRALHEGRAAASTSALSRHAKAAARKRSAAERSASARKGARTRAKRRK